MLALSIAALALIQSSAAAGMVKTFEDVCVTPAANPAAVRLAAVSDGWVDQGGNWTKQIGGDEFVLSFGEQPSEERYICAVMTRRDVSGFDQHFPRDIPGLTAAPGGDGGTYLHNGSAFVGGSAAADMTMLLYIRPKSEGA